MQGGGPALHPQVVGFVDRQSLVDVTVRVHVGGHGSVQRQAAQRRAALKILDRSGTDCKV